MSFRLSLKLTFVKLDSFKNSKLTLCISRALAVGGKDMNTRIYAAVKLENFVVYSLGGHKDEIVGKFTISVSIFVAKYILIDVCFSQIGCFFEKDSLDVYCISRDGTLNVWECDTDLRDLVPVAEEE